MCADERDTQAPKKEKKEDTEEDQAFKTKKKAEEQALKEAKAKGMYCACHGTSRNT